MAQDTCEHIPVTASRLTQQLISLLKIGWCNNLSSNEHVIRSAKQPNWLVCEDFIYYSFQAICLFIDKSHINTSLMYKRPKVRGRTGAKDNMHPWVARSKGTQQCGKAVCADRWGGTNFESSLWFASFGEQTGVACQKGFQSFVLRFKHLTKLTLKHYR